LVDIYLTEEQQESWEAYKLGYPVDEWRSWRIMHSTLFGHTPTPDFDTKEPCAHPMHLAMARAMNGGNVAGARPENIPAATIRTVDDAEIDPRYGTKEYEERLAPGWGDAPREFSR